MMTIYLDRATQEKILEDSKELRFCKNRENKSGFDWCFSDEECSYKNQTILHSSEAFDVRGCEYVRLHKMITGER